MVMLTRACTLHVDLAIHDSGESSQLITRRITGSRRERRLHRRSFRPPILGRGNKRKGRSNVACGSCDVTSCQPNVAILGTKRAVPTSAAFPANGHHALSRMLRNPQFLVASPKSRLSGVRAKQKVGENEFMLI